MSLAFFPLLYYSFGVRRHDAALQYAATCLRPALTSAKRECGVSRPTKAQTCLRTPKENAMQWPHAPAHWLFEPGIFMVTAGTYHKQHHLGTPERRDFFLHSLFAHAEEFGWKLHAWAVLANHYHFLAVSPQDPGTLRTFLGKLHMTTAKKLNEMDREAGRKIWYQYWDSRISFERSYLARLNYVQQNPVHHGLVADAENYRWCSAGWFAQNASPAFVSTVKSFKTDLLHVPDDF
jgi:putative transposase